MQMAIIRLKRFTCDILVTLNTECSSLAQSGDVEMAEGAPSLHHGIDPSKEQEVSTAFDRVVASLRHTTVAKLSELFE